MTFSLVFVYYALGCVDPQYLNNIDFRFIHLIRRFVKVRPSARRASTLRKAVLMFSDQQLVTGIALLVSGYAQLQYGIPAYHWQIIVYLAWFSSLTHLITLTLLRQYFRDNPAIRSWRAFFMFATVIMHGAALSPTGDSLWLANIGHDHHSTAFF